MAGNRVEELERKVRELEATVSGLTDELVETKERLRLVEDRVGQDIDDLVEGRASRQEARRDLDGEGAPQRGRETADGGAPAAGETGANDEPAADPEPAADEAKSDEAEGEDDGSGASDDIIVA